MLKNEIEINQFKKNDKKKTQPILTFKINDSGYEPKTNIIEDKP
jgi:hypothetical protein